MKKAVATFLERHANLADRLRGAKLIGGDLAPWRSQTGSPERVLSRWLANYRVPADTAIAVSGVGDGSHLMALRELLPDSGLVFCAEKDVSRFRAFLETEAAEVLVCDERFLFGVGELGDAFYRSLASFRVMDYLNAEPLVFAPLYNEDEGYYSRFFMEFARQLEMWRKLFGTNLTQSGLWQKNTLANLPRLLTAPDPIAFQSAFEGIPLVMAGAGPSLDESLEFLRWAQDRAVIVAGNSSIRALVRGGVRPHFVLVADPNETTDRGFEGVELGDTVLLCSFLAHPDVAKRFEGRLAAWSYGNRLATYMRDVAERRGRRAFMTELGTVSACAFDLAVVFGSPAIFFVGQDLAARGDGKMHAADSFYSDEGADRASLEKCRWLPGNTIEKVPVEEKLFVYLKTFEEMSRAYGKELKLKNGRGLALFNLSRLGAKIEGMPYVALDKAKALLDSFRSGRVELGWKRVQALLSRPRKGWDKAEAELLRYRSYVEGVCQFALKEALALEEGNRSLDAARSRAAELKELLAADKTYQEILDDGQLKMELYVHRRSLAILDRSRKGGDASAELESLMSYFWAVSEGAYQALLALDASIPERVEA